MFKRLKRFLFEDPTANWPRVVHDPVLGDLVLYEDGWEATLAVGDTPVTRNAETAP